jgi:hypothetical protein
MPALLRYLKKHRSTVLSALPGVLLAVAATWWFLFRGPGPALRHADFLRPETAVRAVLCPALVQSYVSSLAPTATRFVRGIPRLSSMQGGPIRFDWVHKMPLETAFLFDQAFPGRFGVTLFFQENTTGEPLDELVNNSSFMNDLQPILWTSTQLRRESGGRLLAEGQLALPQEVQEQASRLWPQYQPVEPPPIRGNHFFEIGINNCNGALFQMQGALVGLFAPWADDQLRQNLNGATRNVLQASASADLADADCLAFKVEAQCTDPASADTLSAVCTAAVQALSTYLQSTQGFTLEGSFETDQARIVANYQLRGFEPRLKHALGA